MMRDLVVSGGTAGIGAALARHYLRHGARVTVVGRDEARGRELMSEGAGFIRADLSSVDENRRVVKEVQERHDKLDGLVLAAMGILSRRIETADGFEGHFSLYYLSRFLLSHGLTPLLERGESPIITSLGGVGVTKGQIHWDDLALRQRYGLLRAMLQAGRAADLQGVGYVANHPEGRAKFLLHEPGYTDSGYLAFREPKKTLLRAMAKVFAQPVTAAIAPIVELMDTQPEGRLLAYSRRKPLDPGLPTLDPVAAQRLYDATRHLL